MAAARAGRAHGQGGSGRRAPGAEGWPVRAMLRVGPVPTGREAPRSLTFQIPLPRGLSGRGRAAYPSGRGWRTCFTVCSRPRGEEKPGAFTERTNRRKCVNYCEKKEPASHGTEGPQWSAHQRDLAQFCHFFASRIQREQTHN